jgi:hypothetical protein
MTEHEINQSPEEIIGSLVKIINPNSVFFGKQGRITMANSKRSFKVLLHCPNTNDAISFDCIEFQKIPERCEEAGC